MEQEVENNLETKYIELVAKKRLGTYQQIADFKKVSIESIKKDFKSVDKFLATELGLNLEDYCALKDKMEDVKAKIDKIFRNQFSGNKARNEGFGNFYNFYTWYEKQGHKCYYCNTTYEVLNTLFTTSKKLNSEKFNATLHIEQIDPKKGYNEENCKLACSLCNNAKSDLISKENYIKYFAKSMQNFLKDLNETNLKNDTY